MWTLYNKLHGAFIVWFLAQQFDRKRHGEATGYVRDAFFFSWLKDKMGCTSRTARKRLDEALQYGFLEKSGKKRYLIRSYRKMLAIAMNNQYEQYKEDNINIIPPELFLKSDRKFTSVLKDWIDPKDYKKTIALLTGIASIQNSANYRGKLNQSKLLNCHRNTLQRRQKNNNTKESERFIIIDVLRLLEKPSCSPKQIIKIIIEAESHYRRSNYLRGRQLLHSKWVNGKSYLAIQIPGVCTSTSKTMQEVPEIREVINWLTLKSGGQGHRTVSLSHMSEGREGSHAPSRSDKDPVNHDVVGRKRLPLLVELPVHFISSNNLGNAELPNSVLFNYLKSFEDILNSDQCASLILKRTGATRINPIREETISTYTSPSSQRYPPLEKTLTREGSPTS